MIILKFPQEVEKMVRYARIEKPRSFSQLKSVLAKKYSESLSCEYTKKVEEFFYENMEFPEDGIYYVEEENGQLMVYSKEKDIWESTMHQIEDYTMGDNNPLWKDFFTEYTFLHKLEKEIKETIHNEMRKLFETEDWKNVTTIELSTYEAFESKDDNSMIGILMEYFSKELATELYFEIRKKLFSTQGNNFVNLIDQGCLKSMLNLGEVNKIKTDGLSNIKRLLSEELGETELRKIVLRLKNNIIFGMDEEKYEICYIGKDGGKYVKYKDLELPICNGELFIPINNVNDFINDVKEWLLNLNYEISPSDDEICLPRQYVDTVYKDSLRYKLSYPLSNNVKVNIIGESIYDGEKIRFFVKLYEFYQGETTGVPVTIRIDMRSANQKACIWDCDMGYLERFWSGKQQLFGKISE